MTYVSTKIMNNKFEIFRHYSVIFSQLVRDYSHLHSVVA